MTEDGQRKEKENGKDSVGRITGVTGSSFGGITNYASAVNYRAFGPAKSMIIETTDETTITQEFDTGLRLTNYTAVSAANEGDTINKDYTYANDGSLIQAEDDRNSIYSQTYKYDFAGRLSYNRIGELAGDEKYQQTVGYDAFGNITSRSTWNDGASGPSYTAGFTNNRKSSGGYQSSVDTFDVAGNITQNQIYGGGTNKRVWSFDAAGQISSWMETLPEGGSWLFDQGANTTYDGDGRPAKKLEKHRSYDDPGDGFVEETKYRIYSSVTGAEITELNGTGEKAKTSVYLHGKVIAEQQFVDSNEIVSFKFGDPLVGTEVKTDSDGVITPNDVDLTQREPLGAYIPTTEAEMTGMPLYYKGGNWKNPEVGCFVDYTPVQCSQLSMHLRGRAIEKIIGGIPGLDIFHFHHETPDGKNVPDDPNTPEDEEVIGVGSTVDWWEFRSEGAVQTREYVQMPDKISLRKRLVERLDMDDKKCRNFLDAVRKNLGIEKSMEALFDEVINSGGNFVLAPDISVAGVSRYGKKGRDVGIAPHPVDPQNEQRTQLNVEKYISSIFHELIHRGGISEGHKPFAQAGFSALSLEEQKKNPLPTKRGEGYEDMSGTYSGYFSRLMNTYCRPPEPK